MKILKFTLPLLALLVIFGCSKDPVPGCTDPTSLNYNADATEDNGSCTYPIPGCTDPNAANYNAAATEDDGNCEYLGCTDPDGDNYDMMANIDDGSCEYFDRFVGDYAGEFTCDGQLSGLLTLASAQILKKNTPDNTDIVSVLVSNDDTNFSILLEGNITKDAIELDTYIESIDIDINPAIPGPFEVTVTGTLTRDANGILDGPVSFVITQIATSLTIADTCAYTAEKI